MFRTTLILSIMVLIFAAFNIMPQPEKPQGSHTITVCMDASCGGGTLNPKFSCKLLNCDGSGTGLSCTCGGLLAWCCTVDASTLTAGNQYKWQVTYGSTVCTGNCFTYSGGADTVSFKCSNCTGSNKK